MNKVYTTKYEKDVSKIRRAILRHDSAEQDRAGTGTGLSDQNEASPQARLRI